MKKTKLMRAALLLLVLTLITSCFVGGTFAKYVTDGKSTDSARVAKWGVKIDAKGTTFAREYKTDTENVVGTIANSVVSKNEVVAPGTKGEMAKIAITGTPEVAVQVGNKADFKVEGWTVDNGSFYCPLQITVSGANGKITIDGATFNDAATFERTVNTEISTYSEKYAAGTDLSTASVTTPSVSWAWPLSVDDVKDTKLGNLETAPTVSLTVTTTVTQID